MGTSSIQRKTVPETQASPNTRVSNSRSRGTDDPAVKDHDEVETPDSKNARRRADMSMAVEIISQLNRRFLYNDQG
ncbi:hypothetical protein TNCV_462771 [Trichonephila clavipes]|nr:hypothetical protein TNCV_462771 [Trichonephila clavipes]